jgi:vacuolar-type H+-ATPase subunit D/Vma8
MNDKKVKPYKKLLQAKVEAKMYENALREIDTHIRSTSEPIPYIIQTLKETLPEYK